MLCIFFFNDTATTEIYTLSLHDALPIFGASGPCRSPTPAVWSACSPGATSCGWSPSTAPERGHLAGRPMFRVEHQGKRDRKSTRLNSSHANISYAVFCLKKKKK